jgi:hypothetical protein
MRFEELLAAYVSRSDEPDYLLAIEPAEGPRPMAIAFDYPIEDEERYATTLTTLGLALLERPGHEPVELVLDVLEARTREENDALGRALAELVRGQPDFQPGQVLRGVRLPVFRWTTSLFVLDWGHSDPEYLPDLDLPVRLLQVSPIFEAEADQLEALDPVIRATAFVQARGPWDDPDRDPVDIPGNATRNLWARIDTWYRQHAPVMHAALAAGASQDSIAGLEARLGLILPKDLRASLAARDGGIFHSYDYLPVSRIAGVWRDMAGIAGWDPRCIPFARDAGGNLICVDTAANGRVRYFERSTGWEPSDCSCFLDWLWRYQQALYRRQLAVDNEGRLRE